METNDVRSEAPVNSPLVSIIIPVYNGAKYMREAIGSALAQTYKNTEVIVVNDGSSDGGRTRRIALSYGDKIRYFEKENGGVSTALNLGLANMKGDYFSWLSHDDVYFSEKVAEQIDYLGKCDRETILFCNYMFIDEKSKKIIDNTLDHELLEKKPIYALLRGWIHGCTLLIHRSCFEAVGLFDATLRSTQDYDLWFRMAKKYEFVHMPRILVKSRFHAEQGSKRNPERIGENNRLWKKIMNGFTEAEILNLEGNKFVFFERMARFLDTTEFTEAACSAEQRAAEELLTHKVSVVIPFFNRIGELLECVESVRKQSFANCEIVLVNDGSIEDITPILRLAENEKRIVVLQQEHAGLCAARNKGLLSSSGDYVAFLEADDLLEENKVELQLRFMLSNNAVASHTSYRHFGCTEDVVPCGERNCELPGIAGGREVVASTVMVKADRLKVESACCAWIELMKETDSLGLNSVLSRVRVSKEREGRDSYHHIPCIVDRINRTLCTVGKEESAEEELSVFALMLSVAACPERSPLVNELPQLKNRVAFLENKYGKYDRIITQVEETNVRHPAIRRLLRNSYELLKRARALQKMLAKEGRR